MTRSTRPKPKTKTKRILKAAPDGEPPHPGAVLVRQFLGPLGLSVYRVAQDTGLPVQRLHAIVHGQRGITAATDLYLSRYFRRPAGWWLRLQHAFDLAQASAVLGAKVEREVPRLAAADCLPVEHRSPAERIADLEAALGAALKVADELFNEERYGRLVARPGLIPVGERPQSYAGWADGIAKGRAVLAGR